MGALATVAGLTILVFALPSLALAVLGWRNREKPGARGYVVTALGISGWSATVGVEILISRPAIIRAANDLELVFVNLTALGWVLLVAEYRRRRRVDLLSPWAAAFLAIPAVTTLFVATNGLHHLVWTPPIAVGENGRFQPGFGRWFWVHTVYVIALHVGGAVALARDAATAGGVHRRQVVRLLAAWCVGFGFALSGFLVQAFTLPVPGYVDPAPPGFLLASVIWAATLFRHQLFRIVPVGRETAVETMPDAIVSVDADGTVADANPAARDLFGDDAVGTPDDELFAEYPEIAEQYGTASGTDAEVSAVVDGVVRHFSLSNTAIDYGGGQSGRVVVLRDITEVKKREAELDLLRQVLTRVLRHDLGNSLTVISASAEYIRDDAGSPYADQAEDILEHTSHLDDVGTKAKTIAAIVDRSETTTFDLPELVAGVAVEMEAAYPDATIEVDAPEDCSVQASGGLEAAVANLVENGIEHDGGESPSVAVSVERATDSGDVVLRVADDGPGIPGHELDVLRAGAETDLEHGSGVGLWLVQWVADHSGADLAFDAGDDGTTVTLRFQPA